MLLFPMAASKCNRLYVSGALRRLCRAKSRLFSERFGTEVELPSVIGGVGNTTASVSWTARPHRWCRRAEPRILDRLQYLLATDPRVWRPRTRSFGMFC